MSYWKPSEKCSDYLWNRKGQRSFDHDKMALMETQTYREMIESSPEQISAARSALGHPPKIARVQDPLPHGRTVVSAEQVRNQLDLGPNQIARDDSGPLNPSRCLVALVLSQRYTLQQLWESGRRQRRQVSPAGFSPPRLTDAAFHARRLTLPFWPLFARLCQPTNGTAHRSETKRVNVHNGSTMLRSDSRSDS